MGDLAKPVLPRAKLVRPARFQESKRIGRFSRANYWGSRDLNQTFPGRLLKRGGKPNVCSFVLVGGVKFICHFLIGVLGGISPILIYRLILACE